MSDDLRAVTKAYDFALWLLPHVAKFNRSHRFTLGDRVGEGVLETLELLVEATYTKDKRSLLQHANRRLQRVRYLIRLAKDMRQLSVRQYEFAARALDGIGVEVGGWLKQQNRRKGRHEASS
jgi:hypothetical protein